MKSKIFGHSAQTIFDSIRDLVIKNELVDGDKLPTVRDLAVQLNVNRNTVALAYQRLVTAGIAVSKGRLGTHISNQNEAGEQEGGADTQLFDLADGSPRLDWLPCLNKVARDTHLNQYAYGEDTQLSTLNQYGVNWFTGDCPQNFSVVLSNGAIDAIERLLAVHLVQGDTVIVEDPCYISAANAVRLSGFQPQGASIDNEGMCPVVLRKCLEKGAKAVIITPRAHNPTGVSLTKQRASEIQSVLADFPNVLVLLDDHFSLLSTSDYYNVIPPTSLYWAVFRSVSKGLGPDLRLAFIATDRETARRFSARLAPGMSWVSRVLQSLVLTCLTSHWVLKGLEATKQDCIRRQQLLINALVQQGISQPISKEGLNVWIQVYRDSNEVTDALAKKGWLVRPSSAFDIGQDSQGLRVSIQKIDKAIAEHFAADLAHVLAHL